MGDQGASSTNSSVQEHVIPCGGRGPVESKDIGHIDI